MIDLRQGNCMELLGSIAPESVDCVVTSPPYWGLRDYGLPATAWPEVVFTPVVGLPEIRVPAMECVHGLEPDLWAFVGHEVLIWRAVRAALKTAGTCFVNLGDSWASTGGTGHQGKHGLRAARSHTQRNLLGRTALKGGLKHKDLTAQAWRVALALQADGWWLRQCVVWHKPAPVPESVRDRFSNGHEYVFLLTRNPKYFWNRDGAKEPVSGNAHPRWRMPYGWAEGDEPRLARVFMKEGTAAKGRRQNPKAAPTKSGVRANDSFQLAVNGLVTKRNRRSVWTVPAEPFKGAHFATYPTRLARWCIAAGCPEGGTVLDPFAGSGTTGVAAAELGRRSILLEMNPAYVNLARIRCAITQPLPLFT